MLDRAYRALLEVYRRLPRRLRRFVVRTISPSYTVGAVGVVERDDGAVLLVRQVYRRRWGVPGGLLGRREDPAACAQREILEEVGVRVELVGAPAVVVVPEAQRVDVVYRARLAPGEAATDVGPTSPEIVEVAWFPADGLPELQDETQTALAALQAAAVTVVR